MMLEPHFLETLINEPLGVLDTGVEPMMMA
jgi:hypothetical protein